MIKRVGSIEVRRFENSYWTEVIYHCNQDVQKSIDLRSVEDLIDLQYALSRVKAELDAEQVSDIDSGEK